MALAEGLSTGEKYDVFLSFRGEDTREGFTDCLCEFLKEMGLRVFMDDDELHVGESIAWGIQKAICNSKFFVPVFSKEYASSTWCLKEIAWMADHLEEFPGKKEMLPVFYDVDSSDVKLKTDLYAKALLEHERTSGHESIERWKKALIKVPGVKGWNRRDAKGQGKLIKQIAQDVCRRVELKHRILPGNLIGIEEQVQHIMHALDCGSRDVRIVVIHGMGGIGKTTLASAVFNNTCWQYKGCSFLANIRESARGSGILNLQDKLMRDILRFSSPNFFDVNDAMNCIQDSLRNKDVLVVLDDVSDKDQIKKLIGMGDWVGLGSRVIITTRNLNCVANVEDIENKVKILEGKKIFIYQMRELGFDYSLQLLCRHAFGQHDPPYRYEQLTREVISFTRGVPLAIEVIGSCLKRRHVTFWKELLNKLRKVPDDRLYQKILMSSYETLCYEEIEIFLDIAFFFAGHDKTSAFYYWEARGFFPEISVDRLISNALVKIIYPNEFWMHDLLKDLGREVVRKQSNGNLGMCSRLSNEDAKRFLLKRQDLVKIDCSNRIWMHDLLKQLGREVVPKQSNGNLEEKYHVFLSFRGLDTCEGFTDCLYEFLKNMGLRVFMDDEELRINESITLRIQKAIYNSKFFIPVFSKEYASSKWCLTEIAWMADHLEEFPGKKEMHPVFYDVDASDVKLKTDLYAKALLEHEKTSGRETVARWKKALIKVTEVKGWNRRDAKGQGKLIKQIAEYISRRLELNHRILHDHFIGIEEQGQDMIEALDC